MATRCNIGIINPDLSVQVIYCHFDGYYDYTGNMLVEHYTDLNKIQSLIALGDIRYLTPELEQIETYNEKARIHPSQEAYLANLSCCIEHVYLYNIQTKAWQHFKN